MKNYYEESSIVGDVELDYDLKVPVTETMRLIENIVFRHADAIGLDHTTMQKKSNAFWVVTKIKLKLLSNLCQGDKYTISTWTHEPGLVRACRDMMIKSNGKTKVEGSSEWCCLDCNTRKLMKMRDVAYPELEMVKTDKLDLAFTNMRLDVTKKDYVYTRTIRSTDIDVNHHTNNLKYNYMAFDTFTLSELKKMCIKEYEIYFVNECHEGDLIDIYRVKQKDYYYVEGKLTDKTIFRVVMKVKAKSEKKKTI